MYDLPSQEQTKAIIDEIAGRIASGEIFSLDGYMSPTSQAIAAKLETQTFHMNSWWAMTPQDWECPACGRKKIDIARLNHKGHAMCHLVEHHDHMRDLLKTRFREISAARETVVADEFAEKFAKRSAPMVSAYDNTIICVDCNNADANAKKAAQTHQDYSFSPHELRRLIKPQPAQAHEIDEAIAATIWSEQKETFTLRLKIIDRIAEIAANNEHWFQSGLFSNDPEVIYRVATAFESRERAWGLFEALTGPKPKVAKKPISDWRTKRHKPPSVLPTQNEIEHSGRVGSPSFWEKTNDAWCCPICKRNRKQIVRYNNKREWSAPFAQSTYFSPSKPWNKESVLTCRDCSFVAQSLGMEACELAGIECFSGYATNVRIDQIARCIRPQPHCRHNIDNVEAEAVVNEIYERLIFSVTSTS